MAKETADSRVAVTPSLLEEIQDWSEITDLPQHKVLAWLIEQAKLRLAETRPDVIEVYNRRQQIKSYGDLKVAI